MSDRAGKSVKDIEPQKCATRNNMKHHWLTLESVIAVAASLTVIYQMSVLFELQLELILGLYLLSTVATLWMAVRILKDPFSTDKTFDEYFYLDREDIRRNGTE